MQMSLPTPTEDREQQTVVEYLTIRSIPFWHTPNSTFTKSWSQKAKNKRLGVKSGIPDLMFCLNGSTYAIEMKRRKGGTVSAEQKKWIEILNNNGIETIVARGSDEAIDFIQGKEREK